MLISYCNFLFCFYKLFLFSATQVINSVCMYQRWSRGHKARGQGQGHKKILRLRPSTDPLEAKAKDQGHRRMCSPKKRSSNFFFRRSQKKVFKNFFQEKKVFKKFCFRRSLLEETKKKVFADFPHGF